MSAPPNPVGIEAGQLVAAEVRAELARQRVSQVDLAEQLGVSRAYLARRLGGDTPWSVNDLAAVAAILDVPVTSFVAPVDEHHAAT